MIGSKKHKILKLAVGQVKMYDASHTHDFKAEIAMPETEAKHYPSFSLSTKEAPTLKGYKVGDTCNLVMKVKIVSHNSINTVKSSDDDYRLEIQSVGSADQGEKPKDSKTEY